jgi:hypothetical protein
MQNFNACEQRRIAPVFAGAPNTVRRAKSDAKVLRIDSLSRTSCGGRPRRIAALTA